LTSHSKFEVCGEAENEPGNGKAQKLQPDLVVMNLSMSVMNGLDAARAIKQLVPTLPIVMLSEHSGAFIEKRGTLCRY
jgi:DNA-binding NarL/FixJ family response regulator